MKAVISWMWCGIDWRTLKYDDSVDHDKPISDDVMMDMMVNDASDQQMSDENAKDKPGRAGLDGDVAGSNDGEVGSNFDRAGGGDYVGPPLIPMARFEVCLDSTNGWTAVEPWYREQEEEKGSTTKAKTEFPCPISRHMPTLGRLRFRTQSALFEVYGEIGYFDVKHPNDEKSLDIRHRDRHHTDVSSIDVPLDWAVRQASPACTSSCYRGHDPRWRPATAREMADEMYADGWSLCNYVVKNRIFKFVLASNPVAHRL